MPYRILIQLFFFALPFVAYGLYRLLIADAEADGRKAWPVNALFGAGAVLTIIVWFFFVFSEDKERGICQVPARFEGGVLVPAQQVPCDQDVTGLGVPLSDDPGGEASGAVPDSSDESDDIAADTDRVRDGLPTPQPVGETDD